MVSLLLHAKTYQVAKDKLEHQPAGSYCATDTTGRVEQKSRSLVGAPINEMQASCWCIYRYEASWERSPEELIFIRTPWLQPAWWREGRHSGDELIDVLCFFWNPLPDCGVMAPLKRITVKSLQLSNNDRYERQQLFLIAPGRGDGLRLLLHCGRGFSCGCEQWLSDTL